MKVRVTVIDDRIRTSLRECPFMGDFVRDWQRRCNINTTAQPACVGADHPECLLQEYDEYRVTRQMVVQPKD